LNDAYHYATPPTESVFNGTELVAGTKECNETALNGCDDYATLYDRFIKADHDNIRLDKSIVETGCPYV